MKSLIRSIVPKALWTKLRLLRLDREVSHYRHRRVQHVYSGFPLEVELADPLSEGWYDHDWPELPEFKLLQQHRLRPGARVFDLGAHQGVVALILSRYAGPGGSVVAVEANKHNAEAARRNAELNGATNCTVLHAAVSDQPGTVVMNMGLNAKADDGSGEWGRTEVEAVTVDGLAAKYGQPDILFIDVEGYECHALKGAPATLAKRPDAFIEVHLGEGLESFGGSVEKILSYFPSAEYDFFFNEEDGTEFKRMESRGQLPTKRFFLIAVHRRS